MTEQEKIAEGNFFNTIFNDDIFKKRINFIEQELFNQWREEKDPVQRDQIYQKYQALMHLLVELKLPIIHLQMLDQKDN